MSFEVIICYTAAVLTVVIALVALYRDPRAFVHRILAIGLVACALEAGLMGLGLEATSASALMRRHRVQMAVGSFLPGIWLIFSLSIGRGNYKEFLARWKWAILAAFAIPAVLVSFFSGSLIIGKPLIDEAGSIFLRLGWVGYTLRLLSLVGSVVILMNLERTLRYSSGRTRWQVKFMLFGVGSLFGIYIYTDSQVLLYRVLDVNLEVVKPAVLILADLLVIVALTRVRLLNFDFYVSHTFLYNSFSLLFVGFYFILVGIMARVAFEWKGRVSVPLLAFLLFLAIIGLSVLFMSDRFRVARKRFISRHFKRPMYDYQRVWSDFVRRTAAMTQSRELCSVLVRLVSETLEALSVTIWLVDEQADRLQLCGSTVFTEAAANKLELNGKSGTALMQVMKERVMPVHVSGSTDEQVNELRRLYGNELEDARVKYCVSLAAAGRFVGLMTLSDRVQGGSLSSEDYDLLKTIADQAAASLLSLRLSEHLRQLKEREALQVMSAFFMHDLKNLATKLSLVTQNLPVHFDKLEFRDDALRTISQSVAKINTMCTRLSLLSQTQELHPKEADLSEFVAETLSGLDGYLKGSVLRELHSILPFAFDAEQMQKVLVNLLMNANDAIRDGGEIKVTTDYRAGWAEIIVRDDGCGMSREFVEKRLFRPFQTTKKQGMGIGLFHCRTIVEAHGGKIQVESQEGKGTTFRILLPTKGTQKDLESSVHGVK